MSGDHRTVIKGAPSQYVKLNVGGSLHYTTIGTLTKHDSMLRAMFSGRMEVLTDSEGNISKFYIFYHIIFSNDSWSKVQSSAKRNNFLDLSFEALSKENLFIYLKNMTLVLKFNCSNISHLS